MIEHRPMLALETLVNSNLSSTKLGYIYAVVRACGMGASGWVAAATSVSLLMQGDHTIRIISSGVTRLVRKLFAGWSISA
jgi:hypothetical protein